MSAAAQPLKPISMNPDDFVAGGLINDVDVRVKAAEWTVESPENYTENALFLRLALVDMATGDEVDQWWSAGKKAYESFEPYDNGRYVVPKSGSTAFVKDSNAYKFLESLTSKGFPKTALSNGDAHALVGLEMHVIQVAQTQRPGMSAARTDRERTLLVCDRIIKLPGEKAKRTAAAPRAAAPRAAAAAPAAAAAAPAPAAAPAAAAENGDLAPIALEQVMAVLAANNNTIELKALRARVFKALQATPNETRNAIVKMAADPVWLEAQNFLVDETTVTYMP